MEDMNGSSSDRRDFLKTAVTGAAALVASHEAAKAQHTDPPAPATEGRTTLPNTLEYHRITAEAAKRMIAAAEKKAEELGKAMVIAVCDESGNLKAFSRMDNARLLSVQIAQDKAYTAISVGIPTHQWYESIKGDAPLLTGIVHTPRLVVFGGGYPIVINGQVVGGIGVSGGHYSEDMKCAEAALKVL